MATPSAATKRWSKCFLIYGNDVEPRIQNQNPDESDPNTGEPFRFAPICRITTGASGGGPLMFAWKNVSRQFSAADSFQQPVGQAQGSVSSYSWSGTGSPSVSGGSTSAATFTWSTAGLFRIECTVTDSNGITETGRRWVRVVDLPTGADPPITAFTFDPIVGQLQDRGWGGYTTQITVVGGQYVNLFHRNMQVAIYREEYEGDSTTPTSTGEIFSGFIITPEVEIDPYTDRISFLAGTVEQLIAQDGMDTAYHVFFDKTTIEEGTEIIDALTGMPSITAWTLELIYPFHKIDTLTILKTVHHLLRYHITLKIGGTEYGLAQVTDLIVPWWNLGDTADYLVYGLNVPMGRMIDALIGMVPHGQNLVYSTELSQIAYGPIQTAQASADATVDSLDENRAYAPLRPIDGPDAVVRQVILVQIPSSLKVGTVTPIFVKYPSSPASQGGFVTPSQPYWFTTGAAGTAIAKAIYDDKNATKRIEFHVAGHPFRLFNRVSVTIAGQSQYPWSGKTFFIERDAIERNHEWLGGIRGRYLAREVGG